jgi:hypothetical protein
MSLVETKPIRQVSRRYIRLLVGATSSNEDELERKVKTCPPRTAKQCPGQELTDQLHVLASFVQLFNWTTSRPTPPRPTHAQELTSRHSTTQEHEVGI